MTELVQERITELRRYRRWFRERGWHRQPVWQPLDNEYRIELAALVRLRAKARKLEAARPDPLSEYKSYADWSESEEGDRVGTMSRAMARRHPAYIAEDPRARARWKYHVDGTHKVPAEGVRADHFYACSWCRPQKSWPPNGTDKYDYSDGEWEQFLLPEAAATNPMMWIAGRLG